MVAPELLKKYANLLKAYVDILRIVPVSDEMFIKFLLQASGPFQSESARVYRALTAEELEVLKLDISCVFAWQAIAMDSLDFVSKFFRDEESNEMDLLNYPACLLFRQTFPASMFGDIGICILLSAHLEAVDCGAIKKSERLYIDCQNGVPTLFISRAKGAKKEDVSDLDLLYSMYARNVRSDFNLEDWVPDEKDAQ